MPQDPQGGQVKQGSAWGPPGKVVRARPQPQAQPHCRGVLPTRRAQSSPLERPSSSQSVEPSEVIRVLRHFQPRRRPTAGQHVSGAAGAILGATRQGTAKPGPSASVPGGGKAAAAAQRRGRSAKAERLDGPYLHPQRAVTLRTVGDTGVGGGAPVTPPPGREAAGAPGTAKAP